MLSFGDYFSYVLIAINDGNFGKLAYNVRWLRMLGFHVNLFLLKYIEELFFPLASPYENFDAFSSTLSKI